MTSEEDGKFYYKSFIDHQKKGYEITAKMIGYIIERMKQNKIITGNVQITGRIKSYHSAYANSSKKSVDDCFGIRIIGKSEDLEKIEKQLEKILIVDRTKDHRKKKKRYNAVHQMIHIKRQYTEGKGLDYDLFPLIEVQYWDMNLEKLCTTGELSYANYKRSDFQRISKEYATDPNSVLGEMPVYYEIKGNNMHMLNPEETLFRLYPEIEGKDNRADEEIEV